MVPFAGWEMPVLYEGVMKESIWTRTHASIFDVSHMLQTRITGNDRDLFLNRLTVADVPGLALNQSTLSVFTNEKGGIKDDLIINRQKDHFYVVSNAGCADKVRVF